MWKFQEVSARLRFNNFCFKSLVLVFVILTTAGIYWKKKRISFKIEKNQRNVLTLKQTLGLIFFIYCNNVLADYVLASFKPSTLVFLMEELRVVLVENLLTRFVIPIVLIINTKRHLPGLWTDTEMIRSEFFMTKINVSSIKKAKNEVEQNDSQMVRPEPVRQMPEIE